MKKLFLIFLLLPLLIAAGPLSSGPIGGTGGGGTGVETDPIVGAINGIVKADGAGAISAAGAGDISAYGPTALQSASCSANALTLTPTAGLGIVNVSVTQTGDANCAITMGEASAAEGTVAIIKNVSDGAAETLTFTTSANVLRLIQGSPYVMAINEVLILQYKGSEWLEIGRASATMNLSTINLPSSDADPGTTAGNIRHDLVVTGYTNGAISWFDGAGVRNVCDSGSCTVPAGVKGIVERIGATFDGGGAAIAVNKIAYVHIPFAVTTIDQWTVVCDVDSGATGIIITPYMDAYAADTLPTTTMCTTGTPPHTTDGAGAGGLVHQAAWDCNIAAIPADRIMSFKVTTAPTSATWCTVSLKVTR